MKDIIEVVIFILFIISVLGFVLGGDVWSCNNIGRKIGKETSYELLSGCYIKNDSGEWEREERYRTFKEKK